MYVSAFTSLIQLHRYLMHGTCTVNITRLNVAFVKLLRCNLQRIPNVFIISQVEMNMSPETVSDIRYLL